MSTALSVRMLPQSGRDRKAILSFESPQAI
jgi:hypothetical protein